MEMQREALLKNRTRQRAHRRLAVSAGVAALTIAFAMPATASADPVGDLVSGLGLGQLIGGGSDSGTDAPAAGGSTGGSAQGTVAEVDVNPSQSSDGGGDGLLDGPEATVGQSGASNPDDTGYNGHVTILGLLGEEILGVDTKEGETAHSPLQPVQDILDEVCAGSGEAVCLEVLVSDSSSDGSSSVNDFGVARADLSLGGESISAGAAESSASLSEDENCQTAAAGSELARADVLGIVDAHVLQSAVQSIACNGGAGNSQTSDSKVVEVNGNSVPLPGGCEGGTTDAGFSILGLVSVSCNADAGGATDVSVSGSRESVGVDAVGDPALATATGPAAAGSAAAPGDGTPGGEVPSDPSDDGTTGGPGAPGDGDDTTTADGPGGADAPGAGPVSGGARPGDGRLAFTGENLGLLALIGVGLVGIGAVVAMSRPRRRTASF
jgi:hypothetical protein